MLNSGFNKDFLSYHCQKSFNKTVVNMKVIVLFSDMFTQRKHKGEFRAFLLNYLFRLQSYCEVTILTYMWDKLL